MVLNEEANMATLDSSLSQLESAWKTVLHQWEDARALWNDAVRRGFEKDHWAPLAAQVDATRREMDRLSQIIAKAEHSVH